MKKWVKGFILAIASATLCASAVMLTGCTSAKDWLKQQRCEHTWNSGIVTTKATCSDEGETTYTCTKCDKTKKEEIAKLPHVEETVEMKAATCTENGHTDYKKCKVCEEVLVEKKDLPALGHTEIDVAGTDATCTSKGLSDGKYCTRCETYTIAQQEIPALGHTLATLEGKAPTCTETGLTNGIYCKTCSTIYTAQETIKATGHTVGTNGFCQKCGAIGDADTAFAAMESMTATVIDQTKQTTFSKGFYRIYHTGAWSFGFEYTVLPSGLAVTGSEVYGISNSKWIPKNIIYLVYESDGSTFEASEFDVLICEAKTNIDEGYTDLYFYNDVYEVEAVELLFKFKIKTSAPEMSANESTVTKIEKYV